MDQKSWLWRKKSSEKIIVSSDKVNLTVKKNEEETLLIDKARLEKDLEFANDKLSLALSESKSKDELVKKLTNMEQEATAGWEKSKSVVASLEKELNEAVQKRIAGEERVVHLDAALKECMQQLRFVREDQEQRIHDAVLKTSKEFEKTEMILEEKLAETDKRLSKLGIENTQLSKALLVKEKMIEDITRQLAGVEADLNALIIRLESAEKDNASLRYEIRVLEKEAEIRNEEREFNRRTADVSHKQHLESVKKIAKLESECQRLRLLVRKRLPGPAALVKMKNEVEMLGRDSFEMRRRQLNPDSSLENSPETPNKRISVLTNRISVLEEENTTLKEAFNKKNNELQFFKTVHVRSSPKPFKPESPHELSNGHKIMELPLTSMSDAGSDDKVSSAESWASGMISEWEHLKNGKPQGLTSCKIVGSPGLDLMDDFVEMEKLAIVSVEKPAENSPTSSDGVKRKPRSLVAELNRCFPESNPSADVLKGNIPDWLQNILKIVFHQNSLTKRDPEQILEDVRAAIKHRNTKKDIDTKDNANHCERNSTDISSAKLQVDRHGPVVSKLIELVEGISLQASDDGNRPPGKDENGYSETPKGYMVRVLQWKTSELSTIMKQFLDCCYGLLNGKTDFSDFLQQLNSTLDWIMNHCFSLQDVSSIRDSIKKRFDWDESRSECEVETGMTGHFPEVDKERVPREEYSRLNKDASSNNQSVLTEELQSSLTVENKEPKEELTSLESTKKEIGGKMQSASESETLSIQRRESEEKNSNLQELETLNNLKGTLENQTLNHVNQDLDAHHTAARIETNETQQKSSALDAELENKNNCLEEFEATCLELQLQLESTRKQNPTTDFGQEDKQLRTDWEITTASEKLAECQETIFNLGKQLQALTKPKEASIIDKIITTPNEEICDANTTPKDDIHTNTSMTNPAPDPDPTLTPTLISTPTSTPTPTLTPAIANVKTMNNRCSLLDQMLADDEALTRDHRLLNPAEVDGKETSNSELDKPTDQHKAILVWNGHNNKNKVDRDTVGTLAIVPRKKRGDSGLWRKLLWRKKKVRSQKKKMLPFTT